MKLTPAGLAARTGLSIATTSKLVKQGYNSRVHTRTHNILRNLAQSQGKPKPKVKSSKEILVFSKTGKFLGSTSLQNIPGTSTQMIKIDG